MLMAMFVGRSAAKYKSLRNPDNLSFPALGFIHSCQPFIKACNVCGPPCALSKQPAFHTISIVYPDWASVHILTQSSYTPQTRRDLSHQFLSDSTRRMSECRWPTVLHLSSAIDRSVMKCTLYTLRAKNQMSVEIHMQFRIECVWRYSWKT